MNYHVIAQIFQEIKYWPIHWYTKCIVGKYGASNNFYVEFSAYYTTDNKADHPSKYQPNQVDET